MPRGEIEKAHVGVPYRDSIESGQGMVRGYAELWRAIFCQLAGEANEGKVPELRDIKKLCLLSSQIVALTDLKRIKEQFASYKDAMSEVLARKGKIPKEDVLAMLNKLALK